MRHLTHPLVAPVPGTERCIHSFHFGPADSGRKVYIQASLHADELPGMLTAWHLKQRLKALEAAGELLAEVVLVPVANPIGQDQQVADVHLGRYELETGQNFNRRFRDMTAQVEAVIASVKSAGLNVHLSQGVEATIIGAIGETHNIPTELFEVLDGVEAVQRITQPYKLASRQFHPENTILPVDGFTVGGEEIVIIAGPCAVESRSQIIETAIADIRAGM